MALGRVILLLAVGAQVLVVSGQDGNRVVDLAQPGEARPEDMLYGNGKSPRSTGEPSEMNKDVQRNSSSSSSRSSNSSQQLVPQVEIVYDSTGKGWVDKVKQVPDPSTSPSRGARRADNSRKDVIGTEIINDVAYLEIRQDKGQKSPPLVTVRRADGTSSTTPPPTTVNSESTHTGKIHYSQIPYKGNPSASSPASEEVQDDDQAGVSTTTTTSTTATTEAPTDPTLNSEENDEETEAPTGEGEANVSEAEDDEDYADEVASSEVDVDHHVTTGRPHDIDSITTSSPTTTTESDYEDEEEEHETESTTNVALESATSLPVEPSSTERPRTEPPPPETSTIRRIPISKITTPSVNFVMPTEAAILREEVPDPATEQSNGSFSNEEDAGSEEEVPHRSVEVGEREKSSEEVTEHYPKINETTEALAEQTTQSLPDSAESSGEVETESPSTSPSSETHETESQTRAVDPADVIPGDTGTETNATATKQGEIPEFLSNVSNPKSFEIHGTESQPNTPETLKEVPSSGEVVDANRSTEETLETTTLKENLGREADDDDAFPTEKSHPTPDFFSQFVTVNPNMFYGIFKPSPTPQPAVKVSEETSQPSAVSSTTTSTTTTTTTHRPTTPSTISKPSTTTTTTSSPQTTPSTTTTTSTPPAPKTGFDRAPVSGTDPSFVLGLEGLFNFSPSVDSKPSEPVRPSVARFGNAFETLKQTAETETEAAPVPVPSSTSIPSFFGDGAPLEMLHFPWSSDDNDFSGPGAFLKNRKEGPAPGPPATVTTPAPLSSTTPLTTTTGPNRVNLFSKKVAPTLVPTRAPPSGPPKKFNLFASLTNTNNPIGHKPDRRPELRPLKKVSGPWEPSIEPPPEEENPEFQDVDARPERKAFFGKPNFERRLVLEPLPPSTTRRPTPQFHPPTLLHDFAVPPPVDHRGYDMDDFLHRGTPATPRNAKSPISSKARTTLLMCAAIIGGAAIFFATLMVVCMRRTKNKRLIRRRAIDKFIQDSTSESSSSYGGSHSSYGRKGLLA